MQIKYDHPAVAEAREVFIEKIELKWAKTNDSVIFDETATSPIEQAKQEFGRNIEDMIVEGHKLFKTTIVDIDMFPTTDEVQFYVPGLPIFLISRNPYDVITLVHSIPGIENNLIDGIEFKEFFRKAYGALVVHTVLCNPNSLHRLCERAKNSGKFKEYDGTLEEPNYKKTIQNLMDSGFLEKKMEGYPNVSSKELVELVRARKSQVPANSTHWIAITGTMPYVELTQTPAIPDIVQMFKVNEQKNYRCYPIALTGKTITLATSVIPGVQTKNNINQILGGGCKSQFVLTSGEAIGKIITATEAVIVSASHFAKGVISEKNEEKILTERIDISELANDAIDENERVVKLVRAIILWGTQNRATDIHVSSQGEDLWVRYRVDGRIIDYPEKGLKAQLINPIIARLKILSKINTEFSPMPQDGKFNVSIGSSDYEIRVATCATVQAEKVIMRVQEKKSDIPTLDQLGIQGHDRAIIEDTIKSDHGLLIVCGPTGSGKTTTLNAVIGMIDRKQWNVITAEQPVEMRIPYAEQTSIIPPLTFDKFVEAALRQDPDYIMVGETRSPETTKAVIQAAITGHIVMTTLHTNSAPAAASRMIEMGAEPYLVADAITAVCAQRLMRKLCTECAIKIPVPTHEELSDYGIDGMCFSGIPFIYKGGGCQQCRGSGYKGRIGIMETLRMDRDVRRIISHENADPSKIREIMKQQGGRTLFEKAIELVGKGKTGLTDALEVRTVDD